MFFDDDDESDPDRIQIQWERCVDYERILQMEVRQFATHHAF